MATSIFSRRRDLVYLVHFCISLPLMFLVDLQSLYPPAFVPTFMSSIKTFYINTYKDQFFIETPPFFKAFMWSEVLYQAPVMAWAISGLSRDSPKVPLVLLPFATLVFISTSVCMVEYSFWDVPLSQKIDLTTLYGPYLALSAFMGVDMYLRLNNTIDTLSATLNFGKKKLQ